MGVNFLRVAILVVFVGSLCVGLQRAASADGGKDRPDPHRGLGYLGADSMESRLIWGQDIG